VLLPVLVHRDALSFCGAGAVGFGDFGKSVLL
jgi:hypothetical protein